MSSTVVRRVAATLRRELDRVAKQRTLADDGLKAEQRFGRRSLGNADFGGRQPDLGTIGIAHDTRRATRSDATSIGSCRRDLSAVGHTSHPLARRDPLEGVEGGVPHLSSRFGLCPTRARAKSKLIQDLGAEQRVLADGAERQRLRAACRRPSAGRPTMSLVCTAQLERGRLDARSSFRCSAIVVRARDRHERLVDLSADQLRARRGSPRESPRT